MKISQALPFFAFSLSAPAFATSGMPKEFKFITSVAGPAVTATLTELGLSSFQFSASECRPSTESTDMTYQGVPVMLQVGTQTYILDQTGHSLTFRGVMANNSCANISVAVTEDYFLSFRNSQIPSVQIQLNFFMSSGKASIFWQDGALSAAASGAVTATY